MDKRKSSGPDNRAPKKAFTGDSAKQQSVSKSTNKEVADTKKMVKNFWWHSKKVKKVKSKSNAGSEKTKTSKGESAEKSVKASTGVSSSGVHMEIGKKKALQLKKKRQRKNRLLQKKTNSGKDTAGDILREPKTWGTSKDVSSIEKSSFTKTQKQNGEQHERSKLTKSKVEHQSSRRSAMSTECEDSKEGLAKLSLGVQGSSQILSLQKTSRQKERKRKKAKKFKKVNNSKDVSLAAEKKPVIDADSVASASSQDGSSSMKKARNSKQINEKNSIKEKDASSNETEADLGRTGDVSANWRALLPIVDKFKEADAKRHKKYGKGEKRNGQPKESKPDIWFDDVDPSLIKANENAEVGEDVQPDTAYNPLIRKDAQNCLTKCLAMDCEMVGTGPKGSQSVLARVSVVNQFGACVFDKYVTSQEPVTDYRTFVSGIRPHDLRDKGEEFDKVQKELSDLLKGRVVVGHALHNDFKVLYFSHPRSLIRDTSTYQPFRDLFKSKRPGLKKLTELILKVKVQKGEHNSVEDAQAAMKLYLLHRKQWEKSLREKTHPPPSTKKPSKMIKKPATEMLY